MIDVIFSNIFGNIEVSFFLLDVFINGSNKNSIFKKCMSLCVCFILCVLGLLVLVIVVVWVLYYQFCGKYLESINDVFVQVDSVMVFFKVIGYVDQVLVVDNQIVKVGQLLVCIDVCDYFVQVVQVKVQIDVVSVSEEVVYV